MVFTIDDPNSNNAKGKRDKHTGCFSECPQAIGEYRIHLGIRFQSPTWNLTQHFHLTRVATALGQSAGRVSLLWVVASTAMDPKVLDKDNVHSVLWTEAWHPGAQGSPADAGWLRQPALTGRTHLGAAGHPG